MKRFTTYLALLAILFAGCRRDLWVYTDQFRQMELFTDWTEATEQPGGMTWWFMKDDGSGENYHSTTAEVTHTWLGLPRGRYSGVVFDYSPAEYAHQEFVDMTDIDSALVVLLPAADQPLPDLHLYGDSSVADFMKGISRYEPTGMYTVCAEPEIMNADTLHDVVVVTGTSDDRILWDDREAYESTLSIQQLYAYPRPIVWTLHVTVFVQGIRYMNQVRASVSGLTDGCWLGSLRHTSTPCLQQLDNWTRRAVNDSVGYISTTVNTFGLPDLDMPISPHDTRYSRTSRADSHLGIPDYDDRLRLNLQFLLRDNSTVLYYHFDVGSKYITIHEDQLEVNIEIPIDDPRLPDLPYVEEADGTGFDATVTPWADGGTADTTM
jgi:hypothetical protein